MNEAEIDEIERRVQKASRSPWEAYIEGRDHESGSSFIMVGDGENRQDDIELHGATFDDYDFIAHARQDVPKLIAEIRRLKAIIDKAQYS
jgi:hypothetical protein